ncbi:hypothetical protein Tco_1022469, partial [Tanacetum coccineum]
MRGLSWSHGAEGKTVHQSDMTEMRFCWCSGPSTPISMMIVRGTREDRWCVRGASLSVWKGVQVTRHPNVRRTAIKAAYNSWKETNCIKKSSLFLCTKPCSFFKMATNDLKNKSVAVATDDTHSSENQAEIKSVVLAYKHSRTNEKVAEKEAGVENA